ncbi:MAG: hypothetical protein H6606_07410 [Flavobacteriales bacterium]|nr:hypothetical protein [Flavobacteriales bacterium]
MKTSLSKALKYFEHEGNEVPGDKLFPERESNFELFFDRVPALEDTTNHVLVVNPEDEEYDSAHRLSTFLASKELKKSYDNIYMELDLQRNEFIKLLKIASQSSDCEAELIATFIEHEGDTIFTILEYLSTKTSSSPSEFNFKYNDVFDRKGNVKKFIDKYKSSIDQYVKDYEKLVAQSDFFKKSNNTFGTQQANAILKSTGDNAFFEAGHVFELHGGEHVNSAEEFRDRIENEIDKIVNDKTLKKAFDSVDKAIGSNAELRSFKKVIQENNLILAKLSDYETFREETWLGYLSSLHEELHQLVSFYQSKKSELSLIILEASQEREIWKNMIDLYNSRFYVPFKVRLDNQADVLLKEDAARLTFIYSDRDHESVAERSKVDLVQNILSRGERRAMYILQLLFEIESRRIDGTTTLVIFDDIADSFDYKNKYAIIEYIGDVMRSDNFNAMILTHNFDFYRTLVSRLNLRGKGAVLMTLKREDRTIQLVPGQYTRNLFKDLILRCAERKIFTCLIPFFRNLIEYAVGNDSDEYQLFTDCLHMKHETHKITVSDLVDVMRTNFPAYQSRYDHIDFLNDNVLDVILNEAEMIVAHGINDEVAIENKIVLSMAIRLKAEQFMLRKIETVDADEINSNQTRVLFNHFKQKFPRESDNITILDKVVLMTPSTIHLNAFMYEPLIDISVQHLMNLYEEVHERFQPT